MIKVELKLRNNKKILKFEKVKAIFLENGFFIIAHQIAKSKTKFEPLALECIEWWEENETKKKKKSRKK